jgi:hypothetical protein
VIAMGLFRCMNRGITGLFELFFKIILYMLILTFVIVAVVMLFIYWPFLVSLVIGALFSLPFYKYVNGKMKLKLPEYFFMTIEDMFLTIHDGDEEMEDMRKELSEKMIEARKESQDMHNARVSLQEECDKVKKRRRLKNLFVEEYELSPRMIKALEMELGQPKWAEYVRKASHETTGDWLKYRV